MKNPFTGFFKKQPTVVNEVFPEIVDTRAIAREKIITATQASMNWNSAFVAPSYNGVRYGDISYYPSGSYSYPQMRKNSRGLYQDSTITRNIVARLEDTVINTGLDWESMPIWDMIPSAKNLSEEEKYQITQGFEREWRLYSESTECCVNGLFTFSQFQRFLNNQRIINGELIGILRYRNAVNRLSPVTVQLVKSNQLTNPTDSQTLKAIESRGGTVEHGVEYDSFGEAVALHITDGITGDTVRVPFFGMKTGRRFVIYTGNFDDIGQSRGMPELSALAYELKTLADYDTAELEATLASAAWLAAIETDVNSNGVATDVNFKPKTTAAQTEIKAGITTVKAGKFALIQNTLEAGQQMKFFQQNRPNQNYSAFVEAFTNRVSGALGLPLSVVLEKFQASYSAARAEILFYWMNVDKRRDDLVKGFLKPFHEAWFTEAVNAKNIIADGFGTSKRIRLAWMAGTWNGITMPQIDPLKEVNAIEKRTELGHTTGEREAKAYNGSDFRDNCTKLASENQLRANANKVLQPESAQPEQTNPDDGNSDRPDTEGKE